MGSSMICGLPDDLLLKILHRIPIKDAIATSVLCQRWRYVWTMMYMLEFKDEGISEWFIEKTLQLHKAPKLLTLRVKLSEDNCVDVDVRQEWVEKAVKRCVKKLDLKVLCGPEPTRLPKRLYTCETLVELSLSNQILVDVPSPAHLPSLLCLTLDKVVYKDEDCVDRLLSSCPVLGRLNVNRHESDKLKTFMVKVSSLTTLSYKSKSTGVNDEEEDEDEDEDEDEVIESSLVIDSPALRDLRLLQFWEDDLVIEKMHWLEKAVIGIVYDPNVKFLRCFSFVIELNLFLTQSMVACCSTDAIIIFSRLIKFGLYPDVQDWLEPLMFFLRNSPKLNTLTIDNMVATYPSPSWNQPSNIPDCFSNHLEVFRWRNYRGGREGEKQLLAYILANSNSLKTLHISFQPDCNNPQLLRNQIQSIPFISPSLILTI